ncbi:helix-turn-helix domain-containing protein [Parendozoicomonas haliclonae]|uniref:Spore germination protein GerE n=1 Tax=Parendozoicomonas haliclonae TaxID=1960125 RepID=A0A1X7AGC7_9GAMM|nr:helix-turn-helix transcriptional regulator [Parendozoicomonas haliclonae]SMA38501.1 Spore germination protein GerE [Parendozoicomonas haliclonae]
MIIGSHCTATVDEITRLLGAYYTIYAGVKQSGIENGLFTRQDGMKLDVLSTNMPTILPMEQSGQYINRRDANLHRMLNTCEPFIYDHTCRSVIDGSVSRMLNLTFAMAVPVTYEDYPNHKFVVMFYCTEPSKIILEELLFSCRDKVQYVANSLFMQWQQQNGQSFNIFHSRAVFCGRAIEVAQSLADGFSTKETAQKLFLSESGVRYHIDNVGKKMMTRNRGHLMAELIRKGVIV